MDPRGDRVKAGRTFLNAARDKATCSAARLVANVPVKDTSARLAVLGDPPIEAAEPTSAPNFCFPAPGALRGRQQSDRARDRPLRPVFRM